MGGPLFASRKTSSQGENILRVFFVNSPPSSAWYFPPPTIHPCFENGLYLLPGHCYRVGSNESYFCSVISSHVSLNDWGFLSLRI